MEQAITLRRVFPLTFRMFAKSPVWYILLSFLAALPYITGAWNSTSRIPSFWLSQVNFIFGQLCTAVISVDVYERFTGESVTPGKSVRHAWGNASSCFCLSLILCILSSLVTAFSYQVRIGNSLPAGIDILLFLAGLLFFGAFVYYSILVWTVAMPACVIENLSPMESLRRSGALTKGERIQLFGLALAGGFIHIISYLAIPALFPARFNGTGMNIATVAVLGPLLSAVLMPMSPCIYHLLRVERERLDSLPSAEPPAAGNSEV